MAFVLYLGIRSTIKGFNAKSERINNNEEKENISNLSSDLDKLNELYKSGALNKEEFEKKGLIFSALSPDGLLPEIIELRNHPWFVGVQFHPEFKSRPFTPHPLFSSFINAANNRRTN